MASIKALILRAKPYQEADLIIEALGSLGERHSFLAKNASKSRRRFGGGVLDPLQFVELFFTARSSGFDMVHEGKILYGFPHLRQDYEKIQIGLHFLKLAQMVTRDGMDENKILFDLIGNALRTLEKSADPAKLKVHFEIKFLFYLGFYAPSDELTVFTQTPVSQNAKIEMSPRKVQDVLVHTSKYLERVRDL